MPDFWVSGIVSAVDKQPYVQLANEKGMIAQLSMGQARQIAVDILTMAARTEADAMLIKFFDKLKFPEEAGALLMRDFRDYRAAIDQEKIEHGTEDPEEDSGEA